MQKLQKKRAKPKNPKASEVFANSPTLPPDERIIQVEDDSFYFAQLKIGTKVYESSGTTAKEAIENLKPQLIKGVMGILTITHEGVNREKILNRIVMNRLFFGGSALIREVAVKQISLMFDGI